MKIVKSIIILCAAGICSLTILCGFTIIYSFSGIHITNPSGATDYKWTPNQLKTTMDEGFAWMKMDSFGFNNPEKDISKSADILLMGSSHMEAVNIPQNENVVAQLMSIIPELSVYNIGISGHTIYTCAKNMSNAVSEYNTSEYVILETDNVMLDDNKMLEVINGDLSTIPSYNSGILYYIQKYIPAIKTIYKKVEDWRSSEKRGVVENTHENYSDEAILSQFLEKMKHDCGDRKLIIFYHPITQIDENGKLLNTSYGVDAFSSTCKANNIIFVDMTEDFQKLYEEQHIFAHGFINTAVGTGHLNKYGHRIIAERLAKVIMED